MAQRRRSLYDLLEVPPTADAMQIRKAYRKLAIQHHPDRGGNELRFKQITDAYTVLSDELRRAEYDRDGDAYDNNINNNMNGAPQNDPFHFDWASLFGGIQPQEPRRKGVSKEPMIFPLAVDLASFYHGLTKRLRITRDVLCHECYGGCRGRCAACEDMGASYLCFCGEEAARRVCKQCHGSGMRTVTRQLGQGMVQQLQQRCPCSDTGSCEACQGKGVEPEAQIVTVTVLPGMRPGQRILLDSYSAMCDNLQRRGTEVLAALRGACPLPAPLTLLITSYITPSRPSSQAPCQDIVVLLMSKEDTDAEEKEAKTAPVPVPLKRSGKYGIDLLHEISVPLADALCGTTLYVPHFRGAYHGPLPPSSPRTSPVGEGPPIPDLVETKSPSSTTTTAASSSSTTPPAPPSSSCESSSSSSSASSASSSASSASLSSPSPSVSTPSSSSSAPATSSSSSVKPKVAPLPIIIPPLSNWVDNFVVPGLGMPVWHSANESLHANSRTHKSTLKEQAPERADEGAGWACPSCTFLNPSARSPQCEMCDTPNPFAGGRAQRQPPPPPKPSEQKRAPPPPKQPAATGEQKRRAYGDLYISVSVQFPSQTSLQKLTPQQKMQLRQTLACLSGDGASSLPTSAVSTEEHAAPSITVDSGDTAPIRKAEPLAKFQALYSPLKLRFPSEISKDEMVPDEYDEVARDGDMTANVNERMKEHDAAVWQDYHLEETWRMWVRKARDPILRSEEEEGQQQPCRAQ